MDDTLRDQEAFGVGYESLRTAERRVRHALALALEEMESDAKPSRERRDRILLLFNAIVERLSYNATRVLASGYVDPQRWTAGTSGEDNPAAALWNADVDVRRAFDSLLCHETRRDPELERERAQICEAIYAALRLLEYVHRRKPTPDEMAWWNAAGAWWNMEQARRHRR